MTSTSEPHPVTGQPVGAPVDATPAQRPSPVTLAGRYGRIERLAQHHDATLWNAVKGHDHIWTYMSYGPLADIAAFSEWLAGRVKLEDPYSYAIIDRSGQAVGIATLMEIRPAMRVIEVGNILYSPALQRTPLGTEAQYLLARYAFETLGYRRYEWKCDALNALAPCGTALRVRLRRHLPPAYDRKRSQPRRRMVLDPRQRVAGARSRLRALARAGKFRRGRTAEDEPECVKLAPRVLAA